jgi:hypothetical protein
MDILSNDDICINKKQYIKKFIDNEQSEDKLDKIIQKIDNINKKDVEIENKVTITQKTFDKIKELKQFANVGGKCMTYAFRAAIIIATLFIILLIPFINDWFTNKIENTWIRLFVLWLLLIAIVFIVEMLIIQWNKNMN